MNADVQAYFHRLAAAAPPLTPEQRLRLAVLLRPDLPVGISEGNKRNEARRKAAA